ncbi:protein of unknown function DUF820 [Nitrosococcus halophilus Nc 4]|uniref:Putative restriction endonuclease domain-containing protein n=1 Tax=Nitrosococcus halophilus (strain Nc4) TaxID=472759 RepID=D5C4S7_NITHN|nr:Uma2 family endonuclease [Nitrosococcus halophilus]ADE13350.1 protein of unknown function DUF820 [Nitrosococcus halophilus Nc 4]
MSWQVKHYYTPEEYLALECQTDTKSEYFAGEIFAMVGASPAHNLIVANMIGELRQQLKGRPCRVYANDQRVKVSPTGLYTYPDIVVTCGDERFDENDRDTLLNPRVIIEVLSKTTESYDRGEKFEHYRSLDTLVEYLLVAQERPHLEHYRRHPDGQWLFSDASGLEAVIEFPAIDCRLVLAEVYDKVPLETEGPGHPPPVG